MFFILDESMFDPDHENPPPSWTSPQESSLEDTRVSADAEQVPGFSEVTYQLAQEGTTGEKQSWSPILATASIYARDAQTEPLTGSVPYAAKTSGVKHQLSSEMVSFLKDDITTAIPVPLAPSPRQKLQLA